MVLHRELDMFTSMERILASGDVDKDLQIQRRRCIFSKATIARAPCISIQLQRSTFSFRLPLRSQGSIPVNSVINPKAEIDWYRCG